MTQLRITAGNLELIAADESMLQSEVAVDGRLSAHLSAHVPKGWPPEHWDKPAMQYTLDRLAEGDHQRGWWLWYVILCENKARTPRTLIGTVGFKGPPTGDGAVEIGYGIVEEFQRRGLATAACRALIKLAQKRLPISRVTAETYPHLTASKRVMEKLGLAYQGPGSEPGVIRYAADAHAIDCDPPTRPARSNRPPRQPSTRPRG
ncbi:MAG: GNAT family N-acetyltransferase [Phycisphaerales bacterium]|nr:GNAT family N-acetyltransferase [Phycisphaerales bacterium]MCI0674186.1 GNAT family N-acetyltransferase [Phycisphaerales bacterium]